MQLHLLQSKTSFKCWPQCSGDVVWS